MEQEPTPKNSKIADITKGELIVLIILTVTLLAGIAIKCIRDYGWVGEDVKVVKGSEKFHYKIDINKADWPELMLLKGIGEAKAKKIVHYRSQHGRFNDIQELANVDGVSEAMVKNIAEFITVGNSDEEKTN